MNKQDVAVLVLGALGAIFAGVICYLAYLGADYEVVATLAGTAVGGIAGYAMRGSNEGE